jgi:2-polyprenyl-6-methoxyphenol hydroxylase-like FAD-dependent oxidoreductase
MKNQNILISGASLAGPALAYWLSRYGFHPTVVEQTPALREGGYLVVGADGLHSNVRKLAFGDESRFIRHLDAYVSIFTTPNFLHLNHWELYHYAPGKFVSLYSARESSKAMSFFFFTSPPLDYDYRDSEQQKKLLTTLLSGDEWQQIPHLLKAVWNAPDFYFDSVSQIQMDRWSVGRTVLLGDAAYCASPASGCSDHLCIAHGNPVECLTTGVRSEFNSA